MAERVTVDEQRIAVPRDVAARISRLSIRKADYWAQTRLVEPTVDTRGSTGRVPVENVQRYLAAGRSTDDVLEAFPMLTVGDLEAVRRKTVA